MSEICFFSGPDKSGSVIKYGPDRLVRGPQSLSCSWFNQNKISPFPFLHRPWRNAPLMFCEIKPSFHSEPDHHVFLVLNWCSLHHLTFDLKSGLSQRRCKANLYSLLQRGRGRVRYRHKNTHFRPWNGVAQSLVLQEWNREVETTLNHQWRLNDRVWTNTGSRSKTGPKTMTGVAHGGLSGPRHGQGMWTTSQTQDVIQVSLYPTLGQKRTPIGSMKILQEGRRGRGQYGSFSFTFFASIKK